MLSPVPVGRTSEISEIHTWWQDALGQQRQIGFIAGEPGIGKTTLVDAFVASVRERDTDTLIARGQCVDQHGTGEPYLPVLDALGRLCGGAQGSGLVDLLRRHAPAWLVQLPGVIAADEAEALERRLGPGNRQRMLREMAAFTEALTQPLVIVLEDLHWSDDATLHLISTLAQRRDQTRTLLLATYRPVEVAVRNHPLKLVHQELRAHGRCRDLWLQPLAEAAVAAYLRARWGDLEGLETLARAVHARTDGNPLFLVNVANALAADGAITQTDNQWVLRADAATLAVAVPPGLRQMIAARNERLSNSDREILAAGSIAGRTFSAALVAAALDREVLAVEEQLARLAETGQVVLAAGESVWPDSTVAGTYRFQHSLYETVLRDHVPPTLRQHLHRRIAERLETAYRTRPAESASELAFHFEAGGQPDRAVPYIEAAADRALRLGAGHEAVRLLERGIAILDGLVPTTERTRSLSQLCIRLGRALPSVQGYTQPEVEQAYERARALADANDDQVALIQSLAGLAAVYIARAKFDRAAEAAASVTRLKERLPVPIFELASLCFNGMVRYHTGPLLDAREHLGAAAGITEISLPPFSIDPRVVVLCYLSMTLLHLGFADQARAHLRQADERSLASGRPFDRANLLQIGCILTILLRDHTTLAQVAAEAQRVGRDNDISTAAAVGSVGSGLCLVQEGNAKRGLEMIRTGVDGYRSGGHLVALPFLLGTFARALLESGDLDSALPPIAEAQALVASTREQRVEVELYRLEGLIRLRRGESADSERCLRHAIELARQQGALWWELRATTTWAQLALKERKTSPMRRTARDTLAKVVGAISEGADTADVQDARRVLAQFRTS